MHRIESPREQNLRAIKAFMCVVGGFAGLLTAGFNLRSLTPIVDADPADDLQSLRLFADRMQPGARTLRVDATEPEMPPPYC